MSRRVRARRLPPVRVAWGAALLLAPDRVLRALPHGQIDRPALAFARVLGVRDLVQAAVIARRPTRGRILAGAAVDATHATTMVALALIRPDRRKLALTNVTTASAFAVAGLRRARA